MYRYGIWYRQNILIVFIIFSLFYKWFLKKIYQHVISTDISRRHISIWNQLQHHSNLIVFISIFSFTIFLYKFLWKYNLDMIYGHINYHNIELLSRFMKFCIFAAQQYTIVASSLGCVYYIVYIMCKCVCVCVCGIKWVH